MSTSIWTNLNFRMFLIAIILGVSCGFIMVGFEYLLLLFDFSFSIIPYFIGPFLASLLTSLLVKFGKFEVIMGTGSDRFIKKVTQSDDENSKKIQNSIAKTIATSWTYGSGMMCGREGPGLLIGANLGAMFSKDFSIRKEYSFIGASACTAALLKIPISGSLFCAELPYSNHIHYKSLIPSITSSTIAYIIFCLFFGFTPLIENHLISATPDSVNYLFLFPILILFGFIMGLFVNVYMKLLKVIIKKLRSALEIKPGVWILPLLGGVAYSLFLLIIIPLVNIAYREDILHPSISFLNLLTVNIQTITLDILLVLLIIIIISIVLSIGTMNSAGVIMPLMILGAIIGGLYGILLYPENPELFLLLGISALLGAATNNPITAIIIIVEMTWAPLLFIPAGITTLIAYIISSSTSIIPGQRDVQETLN